MLRDAFVPFVTRPLRETDLAFNVLATSVVGSIAQHVLSGGGDVLASAARVAQAQAGEAAPASGPARPPRPARLPPSLRDLQGAFNVPAPLLEGSKTEGVQAAGVPAPAARRAGTAERARTRRG